MLMLPPSVRVYVAAEPTDLRKSFDGLSAAVVARFGQDPVCGHLFVFRNRRADQIRALFWDRTGYCIVAKKLARGRFHLARELPEGATHVEVEAAELSLMLEGIDLAKATRRVRFRLPKKSTSTIEKRASPALFVPSSMSIHAGQ